MYHIETVAANIRNARLYRNYSQDYLAYKLSISQNAYSKIELGYTRLSVDRLLKIAEILEMEPVKLMEKTDVKADIQALCRIAIVPKLLEIVCRTTGMGFAAIARVTDEQWVACSIRDEMGFGLKAGDELKLETTICNDIRQSGQAIIMDDIMEDPQYCDHDAMKIYGFRSYISMPILRRNGTFFGTLCAIDPKPARLNKPEVINMFRLFADLIAIHLDRTDPEHKMALRNAEQMSSETA